MGLRVFPISNRRAADVAVLLARIFGAPNPPVPAGNGPAGAYGALAVGSSAGTTAGLAARPPTAVGNANPAELNAPAGGAEQSAAQIAADLGLAAPVRVQVDQVLNAVVVLAAPADFPMIARTIRSLDVRPRQVYIEAVIAEVALNDELQFGIEYAVRSGSNNFFETYPANSPFNALTPITGGFTYVLQTANARVTLQALSSLTDVRVVSAPHIMVVDNETATLQVGDQVPILTQYSQSQQSTDAPIVSSVELRDTGVILAIRPRIGAGGVVALDVFQEVSDAIETTTSGISSPTIQLRRVQSTINAMSGQTIALGGLMRDRVTRGNSGVPLLNQIPVFGVLFGARSDTARRSELLVMLTPRVLENAPDLEGITNELRARISALAPDVGRMVRITQPFPSGVSTAVDGPPSLQEPRPARSARSAHAELRRGWQRHPRSARTPESPPRAQPCTCRRSRYPARRRRPPPAGESCASSRHE